LPAEPVPPPATPPALPPAVAAPTPPPVPRAEPRPSESPPAAVKPPVAAVAATKPMTPPPVPAAPAPTPAPPGAGRYSIQVGSFQSDANAQALVRSLTGRGYDAFAMDWIDSKSNAWRVVRVGRFDTIEDAKRASAEIQAAANLRGTVVRLR
jgi:DedD protein